MKLKTCLAAAVALTSVLGAHAWAGPTLLFDPSDGKVLYAEEPDDHWHPASLTKIMTAYVVFKAIKAGRLKLEDNVTCSEHAQSQPPSKLGLPVGTQITVETALKSLIIKSANDVAVMLAERVSGSEDQFVAEMNATARELGMTRTTFVNPNGLPARLQVTTARDLGKLARAVVRDFPEFNSYWALSNMRIGKIRLASHNSLLKTFEGADGLKTGFICDSGFNVVASATRDGRRLMAVVLGETSGQERSIRAASLLEHGFQELGWKQLFNTNTIDTMPVAPDAAGVKSVRETIKSWDCGNGRKNPAVASRKERIKAARTKAKEKARATANKDVKAEGGKPAAKKVDAEGKDGSDAAGVAAETKSDGGKSKPKPET